MNQTYRQKVGDMKENEEEIFKLVKEFLDYFESVDRSMVDDNSSQYS